MNDMNAPVGQSQGKGMGIAAMVLGITSFVPGCCFAGLYLNFVLAILAVIFGAIGRKRPGRGMATTGLVLGILNITIPLVLLATGVGAVEMLEKWAEEQGFSDTSTDIDSSVDVEGDGNSVDNGNGQDDGDNGQGDGVDDTGTNDDTDNGSTTDQ
ncbi:MAG: hypothetical protein CMJ67_01860 [Planctomycetaceae bacterium]|nr:hypothetical protein [Planctomycetaceae bacterium]